MFSVLLRQAQHTAPWFSSFYGYRSGLNLKALGSGRYALYNGDINNDGIVNTLDVNSIGNDASGFMGGYLTSDLNGDGIVDALDLMQADNNAANFVSAHAPEILGPISKMKFFCRLLMKYSNSTKILSPKLHFALFRYNIWTKKPCCKPKKIVFCLRRATKPPFFYPIKHQPLP